MSVGAALLLGLVVVLVMTAAALAMSVSDALRRESRLVVENARLERENAGLAADLNALKSHLRPRVPFQRGASS